MIVNVKVPTPGESITEVEIATWMVADGDIVYKDQELAEIESDKATLSLIATDSGKIQILAEEGAVVHVNSIACSIDTSYASEKEDAPVKGSSEIGIAEEVIETSNEENLNSKFKVSPLAKTMMQENDLSIDDLLNGLRRLSKRDVELVLNTKEVGASSVTNDSVGFKKVSERSIERKKMTQLRKKLSQRLVAVKNETAMLTTFNEVDMSKVIELRAKYKVQFEEKFGVKPGFMSFFIKAAAVAMKHHSMVNAMMDGDEILIPSYVDVSVAVQTPKGLMVPVIRSVEELSLADIELKLKDLASKARVGKISMAEMSGGTFTVTNGGVFGSMLSTPLINPPQSAILGMHNIVERPVAVDGNVEIRPIMYLALSYDHRIIDGKDSVGFLVKVKEMIENPVKLLFDGVDPDQMVMGL